MSKSSHRQLVNKQANEQGQSCCKLDGELVEMNTFSVNHQTKNKPNFHESDFDTTFI